MSKENKCWFFSTVQAVYVPADDITDPAPATTFSHLDATTVLSRSVAEAGVWDNSAASLAIPIPSNEFGRMLKFEGLRKTMKVQIEAKFLVQIFLGIWEPCC